MTKPNIDLLSIFDDIIQEGMSDVYSRLDPSIVDFATQKLFNGKDLLYPTQKAILKMYNREPLNEYEKTLVADWKDDDRTTYKEGRVYQHIVIEGGRRMSKSMLLAVVCLYELDKLISLPDPASHYGLLPGSPIALFVISQSLQQVKDTLFAGIRGFAEQSIYFKAMERSKKIEILQTEIRCRSKNVGLYAGHTNSKALVGYSIKLLILDEVARFDIDEFGNSKADHIWDNVGRAVNTFGKEGRKIAISSAWEPNDKIQQLWNMCKKDTSMLGFRFRTWDVNLHPEFTEAKLKSSSDYIQDPLTSALEYEGIRIEKQGSFFSQESIIQVTNGESCVDVQQIPIDRTTANSTRYYAGIRLDIIEKIDPSLYSFAHIDYGVKKDMSAFSVCKPHFFDEKGQWGIKIDGIITWRPYTDDKGKKRIVDFINCEDIMEEVCDARNVRKLSFDSFQSVASIQRLHTKGIETIEMSTSQQSQIGYYSLFRKLVDQGLIILPMEGYTSVQMQQGFACIVQLPNGKITHKSGYKDIPDSIVNCVWNCNQYMTISGMTTGTITNMSRVINEKSTRLTSNKAVNLQNSRNALQRLRARSVK